MHEYHEATRLRDVYTRDLAAIEAMIGTLTVQRTLLQRVTSRHATTRASSTLSTTIDHLSELQDQLHHERDEQNARIARLTNIA